MFRLFGRSEKKAREEKLPDVPDVDEKEQALQRWWWAETQVGARLHMEWQGVGTAGTPEAADFCARFVELNWTPSGRDLALPLNLISFFCSVLTISVESIGRNDSSRPAAATASPFDTLLQTLECLKIAVRSTYNVRCMVEKGGLLRELTKLTEVIVGGLWPLALPIAYLEDSAKEDDVAGKQDKTAQVCQRMDVFARIVDVVQSVFDVAPSLPDDTLSAARAPLPPEEAANLCLTGSPPLAKTLSWSLQMYWTHVVGSMAHTGHDMGAMFNSITSSIHVLHKIIRPVKEWGCAADRADYINDKLFYESEIHVGLIECCRWPVEIAYRHAAGGAPVDKTTVEHIATTGFAAEEYSVPEVSPVRAAQYSDCQLAVLSVLISLIEDFPRYLVHLVDSDLLAACCEVALWHTVAFTTPQGRHGTADRIRHHGLVASSFCTISPTDSSEAYERVDASGDMEHTPLQHDCAQLLNVLCEDEGRLRVVLDRIQALAASSQSVKDLHDAVVAKQAKKGAKTTSEFTWTPDEGTGGERLWTCADRLDALPLTIFSPNSSALTASTPSSPHVQLALCFQRHHYQLQIFGLSALMARLQAGPRMRGGSQTRSRSNSKHGTSDKCAAKEPVHHSLFIALNLHSVVISSDFFYMAAYKVLARHGNLAEPLPFRWETPSCVEDDADRTLYTFLTQVSRHVLHSLVLKASRRDLTQLISATLRHTHRMRYTAVAVSHLCRILLAACRRKHLPTGALYLALCVDRNPQLALALVDTLIATFEALHAVVESHVPSPTNAAKQRKSVVHVDPSMVGGPGETSPSPEPAPLSIYGMEGEPMSPELSSAAPADELSRQDSTEAGAKRHTSYRALRKLAEFPSSALGLSRKRSWRSPPSSDRQADDEASTQGVSSSAPETPSGVVPPTFPAVQVPVPGVCDRSAADWSMCDVREYVAARNVVLNVFEAVVVLPPVQRLLLAPTQGAGLAVCRNLNILWACLEDPALRDFAVEQLSYLLRNAGQGLDHEGLSKLLRPAVNELISMLNWSTGAVVVRILQLFQSVLETLDQEEMRQMTQVVVDRPNDARRRKRVIQSLDRDCYLKIVATLNTKLEHADDPSLHGLRTQVVDTLAWLLRGNIRAKEQFKQEIGWEHVGETLLDCTGGEPEETIFDHLFKALLDAEGTHIENEEVLLLILRLCYHPKFAKNRDLVLSLTDRLKSVLTSSTHNLERASRADVLTSLVDMVVHWDDESIREHLVESYHRVGRHNITVRQLKPLFTTLRDQPGRKRLLLWFMRLLRNLAKTRSTPLSVADAAADRPHAVPPAFFNFSAVQSGLRLPDVTAYPSSSGYSISTWLRIEGFVPPFFSVSEYSLSVEQNFRQYLYSLVSDADGGVGFSAYLTHKQGKGTLHLAVASGDGESEATVDGFEFAPGQWYHFVLSHSSKRIISRSEAKLYIDGAEVWRGGLRYPRNNVKYSAVVGSTLKGIKGQTLLHNFYGQLGAIYFVDNSLSASAVKAIYDLGPTYMSNVISHEKLHKLKYDIKIYMLFNPLAVQGDVLINVANLDHMEEISLRKPGEGCLAHVGKGTQVCHHRALHDVLDSLGGIDVLFPLLAILSDHGIPLVANDSSTQWYNDKVIPYLVSCLVSLFNDLLETQPETFIRRVETGRLFHVMNYLLKPIAGYLDKSTVACISQLLWNVGAVETQLPPYLASKVNEAWKDGFLYLFLDLSLWVQVPADTQKELFSTLFSICKDEVVRRRLRQFNPLNVVLDQMMWFLYYDVERQKTSVFGSPGEGEGHALNAVAFRDHDLRDRMLGKRGACAAEEIRAVRMQALDFVQLLMHGCVEEDVVLLCSSIMSPDQDAQQCLDLLDFLCSLIDQKKEPFVDLLVKNNAVPMLLTLVSRSAVTAAALACLGSAFRYSKRLRDMFATTEAHGMAAITDALRGKPFTIAQYKVLRDIMLGTLRCPSRSIARQPASCKPLSAGQGKYSVECPAAMVVVWSLFCEGCATVSMGVKQLVVQDLLCLYEQEAPARLAARLGWPQYGARALVQLQADAEGAAAADPPALLLKHASDIMDCMVGVVYHAMGEEKGWHVVDSTVAALDYQQDRIHSYEVVQAVLTRLVGRINADLAAGGVPPPPNPASANWVYVLFFVEDLLCFNGVVLRHMATLREQVGLQSPQAAPAPSAAASPPPVVVDSKDSGWLEVNVEDEAPPASEPPTPPPQTVSPLPPALEPTPREVHSPSNGHYEALLRTAIADATGATLESPPTAEGTGGRGGFSALAPVTLPYRSGYSEVSELRIDAAASSWEGWHLAAIALRLLLGSNLYKYHEFRKDIDQEFRYRRIDTNEMRSTTYLSRPGGLGRLCVRLVRLCLTYAPALPAIPIPDQHYMKYPDAMEDVMRAVRAVVALDKKCGLDRDRFGELETPLGGKRLNREARGRTLTILNCVAKYIVRGGVAKYSNAVLPAMVQVFFGIVEDRRGLLTSIVGADPWKELSNPAAVVSDSVPLLQETFEAYLMAPAWNQLNREMLPAVDWFDKEVNGLWYDVIKRRELVTLVLKRQRAMLRKKEDERLDAVRRLARFESQSSTMVAHYRDLARTSDKFWRQMVASVTNERGSWANPKVETQLVMRSSKEVGNEYCKIRAKLRRDPKVTDHSDITARTDLADGGKGSDVAVKITKGDGVGDDEEDEPEAGMEGVEEVDEPPPLTESCVKFPCEIISLMQGWSGSLQIDVAASQQMRYLWVLVDEENTAFVQTINPASERLVEKPKDEKFAVDNLKQMTLRRYRLQWSAVEFFFLDGTSILLNFMSKDNATKVFKLLGTQLKPKPKNLRTTQMWASAKAAARELKYSKLQERWVNREISNFEYLMALNHFASRTVNDLTQYPVMPWVLSDYTSSRIDLEDKAVYRDLSCPMGCLSKTGQRNTNREEETAMKYESLAAMDQTPYHFGSHYSNSGFTLFYLIRLEPYTTCGVILQGARFDHADRMFDSLQQTWHGVTHSSSDVKELIPEFFYQPEMFVNNNDVKFGTRQDGRALHNVQLPPWAASPEDFIRIHREALESEHVSAHLHEWIDLIYGHKQYGDEGRNAVNIFHPYTYEQTYRELQADEMQRQAMVNHLDNFGQCPVQLFTKRHPARTPIAPLFHPLKTRPASLVPMSTLHRVLQKPIVKISLFSSMEQLAAIGENGVVTIHKFKVHAPVLQSHVAGGEPGRARSKPMDRRKQFTFDSTPMFQSRALQAGMQKCPASEYSYAIVNRPDTQFLFASGLWNNSATVSELVAMHAPPSVLQTLYEHRDVITCIAVADDHSHVVTGSKDTTLSLWSLRLNSTSQPLATLKATLFGHEGEVLCVAINHWVDLVASGSADGVALLYNVSEGSYERTLAHPQGMSVDLITITASGSTIFYSKGDLSMYLFSLNGRLLHRVEVNAMLYSLALTSDSSFVVCGGCPLRGDGSTLFARSTHDLAPVCTYQGAPSPVRSVAIHKEHQVMAVGLDDGSLMFYSVHIP